MSPLFLKSLRPLLDLLENHRWWLFAVIYAFGAGVYYFGCQVDGLVSLYQAFTLFTLNVAPVKGSGCNTWVYLAGFVAAFYTALSVISLIAKRFIDTQSVVQTSKSPYILVCGLGQKGCAYIDSELLHDSATRIIAIEKDAQNPNIEKYRAKGVAIKVADARDTEVLKTLQLAHVQHMVLLTGKDTDNLEIALALREMFTQQDLDVKKLFIHIDDRGLDKFYKDGGLLDDTARLEIKIFSLSRNSARALFLEHFVDGDSRVFTDSDRPFSLVVAGYSKLALEVIGQIGELAHLPNENKVTIYCVDEDAARFRMAVENRYINIGQIPSLTLEYVALSHQSRDFYTHALWENDITNIMLCYDNAQTNLDVAAELADSTFLYAINTDTLASKIHIAIYDNDKLADHINNNQVHFKYFDVFAQTAHMASREMVVDEKFEIMAMCIHAGYEMRYNPDTLFSDQAAINRAWYKTARLSDRDSSRAQAYHIPIKLKALGMGIRPSSLNGEALLLHNRRLFHESLLRDELTKLGLDEASMAEKTEQLVGDNAWNTEDFAFFPSDYETFMEKLLRAEHNRWNAHHWLKGWTHNTTKNPALKQHDCLVPLADLPKAKRHTIIYDVYSVLYIPNLLAKAGYELVKWDDCRVPGDHLSG